MNIAEIILTAIGLAYFLDVQSDGDFDLPHKIDNSMMQGFNRLLRLVKKLLRRLIK